MNQSGLEDLLADLPLGSLRYFASVDSTNNLAARWAQAGVGPRALVAADEQTAGRGRHGRHWYTPPGAALAFSMILRPEIAGRDDLKQPLGPTGRHTQFNPAHLIPRYTALGALAVCDTLNEALPAMLPAQIKWPNDVVATRRKLAGVLAEAHWQGERLDCIILGIGINVAPDSMPPIDKLNFPATCVEAALEIAVNRWELLHDVLAHLLEWLPKVNTPEFISAWERRLAFRGERVQILFAAQPPLEGRILGLAADGSLKLHATSGNVVNIQTGEINLRPQSIQNANSSLR